MQTTNEIKKPEDNPGDNFESLSLGFDGGRIYGLEYILEEFFQNAAPKPSVYARSSIDWFGLYS
jgi:hypothetical protein